MTRLFHNKRMTTCLILCFLFLATDALDIFSSKVDNTTENEPLTLVDAFFAQLDTISDPIQLTRVLGTFERLQQLKFIREQLKLRSDQRARFVRGSSGH